MPPRCRTAEKMLDPSEKVWSTLRCLEYQLEAHEARFHRDGDVNWQAIRHMIMVAQHEARTTGAALRRAWTDEDAVGDDLAQIKLQLRETEQELQRLRQVHMEFQSEELQAARLEVVRLREQLNQSTSDIKRLNAQRNREFQELTAANADRVVLRRCLGKIRVKVAQIDEQGKCRLSLAQEIRSIVQQFDAADGPGLPTDSTPHVTEPIDDSTGSDGPGQS